MAKGLGKYILNPFSFGADYCSLKNWVSQDKQKQKKKTKKTKKTTKQLKINNKSRLILEESHLRETNILSW